MYVNGRRHETPIATRSGGPAEYVSRACDPLLYLYADRFTRDGAPQTEAKFENLMRIDIETVT